MSIIVKEIRTNLHLFYDILSIHYSTKNNMFAIKPTKRRLNNLISVWDRLYIYKQKILSH